MTAADQRAVALACLAATAVDLPADIVRTIRAGMIAADAPTAAVRTALRVDALVALVSLRRAIPYVVVVRVLDQVLPHVPPARRYWVWARLASAPREHVRGLAASEVSR